MYMHHYFVLMKDLVNHLFVIGETAPHKDLTKYIMCDLGSNYRVFITSLNMNQTKPNLYEL